MNSFERRVLFCVACYTLFLTLVCPCVCVAFFWNLEKDEAIAATIVLFLFCAMIFIICYWLFQSSKPDSQENLARDADAHADHIARKILVEELYKQLKSQR